MAGDPDDEDSPSLRHGARWIAEGALELGIIGALWAAIVFVIKRMFRERKPQ